MSNPNGLILIPTRDRRQMPVEFRTDPEASSDDRRSLAHTIAQLLYSLDRREQGLPGVQRLQDAPRTDTERFIEAGEMVVQMTFHRALERTAIMAAADVMVSGDPDIEMRIADVSRTNQAFFFKFAQAITRAYRQTLRFESPDPWYDRRLDDLLAQLEAEKLVNS